VKGLAELHGGTVTAYSAGLGQGSTFTVRMPLQEAAPELDVREPASPAQSIRARKVLLIDDNHDAARSMGMLLKHLGYEVELAYTGPEGLEAARRTRPDVILCDIGLPGLDGFSVARVLRSESSTRDVYLIAISGYGQTEDIRKALDAGFDLHLVKPVDFSRLELALNSERHKADIPAEI
jgi:CheY-like chemotaxis protein